MGRPGFDYSQITDEVFIGTNMCCQVGFSQELLSKGVRADISLEQDRTDAPRGVDYFLWLPTRDGEAPSQERLVNGVRFIERLIRGKVKMFIHCRNGHGRAPTLFAAYLISQGMGVQEAISFIKSKRPSIHFTEAQVRGLEAFKAHTSAT
jgi:protein-tyrosine phosphatase